MLTGAGRVRKAGAVATSLFEANDRPTAIGRVSTAIIDGEAVLYHEAARTVHRLNAVASSVWLLSDGETSVNDMATELSELFAVDADVLGSAIDESLKLLADAGLLAGHEKPLPDFIESIDDYASDDSRIIPRPGDP
ncbi:unannotated protein [freshwater metagenome]|uniref:Unannotated protein n=1 Tax=freshwater metagenome TaxID=449393 RepID=A0A6J7CZZ7_9ZZZZ|nr:PqqD family peptide modification chaperone [Actinomycetota bacterium]